MTDPKQPVAWRHVCYLLLSLSMVTAPHAPVPVSPVLEDAYRPSPERVIAAAREVLA